MSKKAAGSQASSPEAKASLADSTAVTLLVAAILAGAASYAIHQFRPSDFLSGAAPKSSEPRAVRVAEVGSSPSSRNLVSRPASTSGEASVTLVAGEPQDWIAAAPGRVEPRRGETRMMVEVAGRVAAIHAALGDDVEAGDVLVMIDDREVVARLAALRANEQVRRRERDDVAATGKPAQDRRRREDELFDAERLHFDARLALDDAIIARRKSGGPADAVAAARATLIAAEKSVQEAREALVRANAVTGLPAPARLEAAVAAARSDLALVELAVDRHRLRAPVAGRLLELNAKVGEMAAPNQMVPSVVVGDLSGLRLRAEVEERDIAKVRNGQRVQVRSSAFPEQTFLGTVTTIAPSLGAPRLAARGPRKPNDVEVLEVLIDLDGRPPLKPGQRVDIYFTKDGGA